MTLIKIISAADADKSDDIFECIRQLSDVVKTYYKLTENEIKTTILEIQKIEKLKLQAIYIKKIAQKKKQTFCCQKCTYDIPHFYIIWKILKNPFVGAQLSQVIIGYKP